MTAISDWISGPRSVNVPPSGPPGPSPLIQDYLHAWQEF